MVGTRRTELLLNSEHAGASSCIITLLVVPNGVQNLKKRSPTKDLANPNDANTCVKKTCDAADPRVRLYTFITDYFS